MLMICRLVDTVQWNKTTQHDTNEIFGHSIICCQLTLKFIWPQSGLQCPFWLRVAESSSPPWWRPACCRASPSSRPSWCSRLRPHPEGLIVNKLLQMFYNRETNYDVDDAHCFSVLPTWKANHNFEFLWLNKAVIKTAKRSNTPWTARLLCLQVVCHGHQKASRPCLRSLHRSPAAGGRLSSKRWKLRGGWSHLKKSFDCQLSHLVCRNSILCKLSPTDTAGYKVWNIIISCNFIYWL